MKYLSLFSGIGGFDLGLDRAGMTCIGQVEIDPYCRAVLEKHWPDVPRFDDVRSVRGDEFGPVDLVCGGVPCQPASCAGKRKGADDERWLWGEFVRIVRDSRCSWFIAENVRGFLSLPDAPGVVRDLEGAGFEVRSVLLGAHHVGAPHRRDRIWIVGRRLADAERRGPQGRSVQSSAPPTVVASENGGGDGSVVPRPAHGGEGLQRQWNGTSGASAEHAEPSRISSHRWPSRPSEPQCEWESPRLIESRMGGATNGIPRRVAGFARRNALRALGNAVVPQVAEVIGRAIMDASRNTTQ